MGDGGKQTRITREIRFQRALPAQRRSHEQVHLKARLLAKAEHRRYGILLSPPNDQSRDDMCDPHSVGQRGLLLNSLRRSAIILASAVLVWALAR